MRNSPAKGFLSEKVQELSGPEADSPCQLIESTFGMCTGLELVVGKGLLLSTSIPNGILHLGRAFEVREGLCLPNPVDTSSFFSERGTKEVCALKPEGCGGDVERKTLKKARPF